MLLSCPGCTSRLMVAQPSHKPVLHPCPGHGGMLLPLVPDGVRALVSVVEREDYIGSESPVMHEGRPIMAVTVTRDDGEDRMIFAPVVTGGGSVNA